MAGHSRWRHKFLFHYDTFDVPFWSCCPLFVLFQKLNDNAFDQLKDEKTTPTIKEVSRESSQEVSSGSLFGGRLRKSSETLHKSNDSLKSADDFTSEFASLSKQRLSFKKNIQVR